MAGPDLTQMPNSLLRYHKLYGMVAYNAAVDDTLRPTPLNGSAQ